MAAALAGVMVRMPSVLRRRSSKLAKRKVRSRWRGPERLAPYWPWVRGSLVRRGRCWR